MSSPIISVIVPVYQAETTLRRCLNSILSQTFNDFEVLLVNDGSTDHSGEICDEYAKKDARVRYFEKTHSGVSDTRQMGLDNSIGDYVIHCDSDDWMEPNMLEVLCQNAYERKADIVVCDYVEEYHEKAIVYHEFPKDMDCEDFLQDIQHLSFSLWNKLVRRSFLISNCIRFYKSITYAEDMYVTFQMLNSSPILAYVPKPFYHYNRLSENSLTVNFTNEWLESHQKVAESLKGTLKGSLLRKLNGEKCEYIMNVFNTKMYDNEKLRTIYPEVHELILYSSLSSPRKYPLVAILFRWKLIFYVPNIFLYILRRVKDKLKSYC